MKDRWGGDSDEYGDSPGVIRTPRWMAASVMLAACIGFVGLAYYAYHAGTRAMRDEDLTVIEADNAPVKEKPADPGGMQFPNQDKSIFDVASGAQGNAPAVERVLPGPEEPIKREQVAESGNANNWINDKLNTAAPKPDNAQDALIEKTPTIKPDAPAPVAQNKLAESAGNLAPSAGIQQQPAVTPAPSADSTMLPEVSVQPQDKPADKPAAAQPASPPSKVELKKEEPAPEAKAEPKAPAKPVPSEARAVSAGSGKKQASAKGMIQLGSFRSENEATNAWKKLHGKYKGVLSGSPDIEKANLGEKGTYYRLRTHVAEAKAACQSLTAHGQACVVVK